MGSRVEETQATPSNYSASYVNAGGSNHANGCGANTNANGSYASHGNASNLATTTSASGACSSNSSSSSSNIREPEEAGEIVAEEGDPENVGELPSATVVSSSNWGEGRSGGDSLTVCNTCRVESWVFWANVLFPMLSGRIGHWIVEFLEQQDS